MPNLTTFNHKLVGRKITQTGTTKHFNKLIKTKPVIGKIGNASKAKIDDMIAFQRQLETQNKLQQYMAILRSTGVDGLDELGKARLSGQVMPSAGIFVPSLINVNPADLGAANGQLISGKVGTAKRGSRSKGRPFNFNARRINTKTMRLKKIRKDAKVHVLPAMPMPRPELPAEFAAVAMVRVIEVAYMFANEIDFSADTDLVVHENISKVVILANQIVTGSSSVSVTWSRPAQTPADPDGGAYDGASSAAMGSAGGKGADGGRGAYGKTKAPDIEIWTPNPIKDSNGNVVTTALTVNLSGQNGTKGGDGMNGQKGGKGHRGRASNPGRFGKNVPFVGGEYNGLCDSGPGKGKQGGRGGTGGIGGQGGDGGNGGSCSVYAGNVADFANTVFVGDKGRGGQGGNGGSGGPGGPGGDLGDVRGGCANTPWKWESRKNSPSGSSGQNGQNGNPGDDGVDGNLNLFPFDPVLFTQMTSSAAITTLSVYKAKVGDTVHVNGLTVSDSDKLVLDGSLAWQGSNNLTITESPSQGAPGSIGFTVPPLEGGAVTIQIQDGSYLSNSLDVYVLPSIASLSHTRIKPGETLTITGNGFSPDCGVLINDQPMSDTTFVSDTEMQVVVQRPTNVPNSPDGEDVEVKVIDNQNNKTSALPLTLDTFRIIYVGDSIFAGQGHDESDMFTTLVTNKVKVDNPEIGVYPTHLAHSGAVLEDGNGDLWGSGIIDKEIPSKTPSINAQFDHVTTPMSAEHAESVDLIVMDGGHNDMGEDTYLQPEILPIPQDNRLQLITDLALEGSYVRLKRFLLKANTRCPNAKIIVCGYYQLISNQSTGGLMATTRTIAGILGPLTTITSQIAFNSIVEQCKHAVTEINQNMIRAVNEANAEIGSNVITFVDVGFDESNSMNAPNSFIWEVDIFGRTEDPLTQRRRDICTPDNCESVFICERASTGHPNGAGNQRYFERISAAL